jgi:tight adherence protein B
VTATIAAFAVGLLAVLLGNGSSQAWGPPAVALLAALVCAALAGVAGAELPLPLVAFGAAGGWALQREVRRRGAERIRERRAATVVEVCEGIAADLRAGLPPVAALGSAAGEWREFRPVLDAARLGGDIPAALRELAERPGAASLRSVAAAWVVAHRSGAGLAGAVELAARAMREDRATVRVVETELASARATAKLLAGLPLGVLLLGRGTGGDPFHFLLSTTPGLVCLGSGLALMWAGLAWIERIARGVRG